MFLLHKFPTLGRAQKEMNENPTRMLMKRTHDKSYLEEERRSKLAKSLNISVKSWIGNWSDPAVCKTKLESLLSSGE